MGVLRRGILGFLAALSVILVPFPAETRSSAQTSGSSPLYVVLIVLDGARPDYFRVPNIPHISALRQAGTWYRSAWAGILESVTPAGHMTIATGTMPNKTGVVGFGWPGTGNRWVSLYYLDGIRGGLIDDIVRQSGVPTIAGRVHLYDRAAKVVGLGGYKFYANDALAGPWADVVMYYADTKSGKFTPRFIPGRAPPPGVLSQPAVRGNTTWAHQPLGQGDHLAMELARASFQAMHQRVTLVNLPEFDMPLGHMRGANRDPADVAKLMQGFDQDLGQLEQDYARAGVLGNTLFVITADHGFAPLDRTISQAAIENAVKAAGNQVIHGVYQTGAYLWLRNPAQAATAGQKLAQSFPGVIQSVYVRQPASTAYVRVSQPDRFRVPGVEEANQNLLQSFAGPHSPDMVVFFKEGTAAARPSNAAWKGDHGGGDWESQHIPLLISGPGVRQGYESGFPAREIDIAPTLLTLMGASAAGMQGIPLADAMVAPPAGASQTQQSQQAALLPLVTALQAEAKQERASK